MTKRFALSAHEIKPMAEGRGACIASDRIVIDGQRVGFMYREPSESSTDSGWRFFCGDESEEYLAVPSNFGLYDVNTIANYDSDVIPYLDASEYAAFLRDPVSRKFSAVGFPG